MGSKIKGWHVRNPRKENSRMGEDRSSGRSSRFKDRKDHKRQDRNDWNRMDFNQNNDQDQY